MRLMCLYGADIVGFLTCCHASSAAFIALLKFIDLCPPVAQGSLKLLQENQQRENDCIYLFELESSAACPAPESKLSTGSILLIMCAMTVSNDAKTTHINRKDQ